MTLPHCPFNSWTKFLGLQFCNSKMLKAAEVEEALKVLEASLTHIKWRLKSYSKCRLSISLFSSILHFFN
ncbi:hypothetical protein REPUB_Repub12eG0025000 [Reevesia pubescens]